MKRLISEERLVYPEVGGEDYISRAVDSFHPGSCQTLVFPANSMSIPLTRSEKGTVAVFKAPVFPSKSICNAIHRISCPFWRINTPGFPSLLILPHF